MPKIEIDDQFWSDQRVEALATRCGEPRLLTEARLLRVWYAAYIRTTYLLAPQQVEISSLWTRQDVPFSTLLVQSGLAECHESGHIIIKGVRDRIAYLRTFAQSRSRGGKARAKQAARDEKGHFIQHHAGADHTEPVNPAPSIMLEKPQVMLENTQLPPATYKSPLSIPTSSFLQISPSSTFRQNAPHSDEQMNLVDEDQSEGKLHPLAEIWNEAVKRNEKLPGSLPSLRTLSDSRKKAARRRWKENTHRSYWEEVAERVAVSPYCRGCRYLDGRWQETEEWTSSFDHFVQPDTHIKAMEGRYDGKKKKTNLVTATTTYQAPSTPEGDRGLTPELRERVRALQAGAFGKLKLVEGRQP